MSLKSIRRSRWTPFLAAMLIIFLPGSLVAGTLVADRLGYCVNDMFPGETGLNTDPYIQNVNADSATITWRTAAAREGLVRYGVPGETPVELELPAGEIQVVPLENLKVGTTYEYTVVRGDSEFEGSFQTAPGPESGIVIGVIGDSGTGSDAQYDIAEQLEAIDPNLVLHTGDIVYRRGALCHYGPKYFSPYADLVGSVPVYPTAGNHDLKANGGKAYFETFALPANNPAGTEFYYSFDYGPVHVVSISSELYANDDPEEVASQRAWLEADLAQNESAWTIVFTHRPPYTSTGGKISLDLQADLAPLFAEQDVDLVLAGHAHNYERMQPIDGVTYLVTGGGGASLYGLKPGELTAFAAKTHHLVRIDATPDALTISAIDRDGNVIDEVTLDP